MYVYFEVLPLLTFGYISGPFKGYIVRYGYDASLHPESRFLQVIHYRMNKREFYSVKQRWVVAVVLYIDFLYCIVLSWIEIHWVGLIWVDIVCIRPALTLIALHCPVQYCTLLHCIVPHCTEINCTAVYCIVLFVICHLVCSYSLLFYHSAISNHASTISSTVYKSNERMYTYISLLLRNMPY